MSGTVFTAVKIALYCLPVFLLVFFSKSLHKHFLRLRLPIKLPDLIVPFLMVGVHVFSDLTYGFSLIPYLLIFIFSLAIVILLMTAYKKGEILYGKFFKTWWRFVYLSSFIAYYFLVFVDIILVTSS